MVIVFVRKRTFITNSNVTLFTMEFTQFVEMNLAFRNTKFRTGLSMFEWQYYVKFGFIHQMFSRTGLTEVDVANCTVQRGDWCLTQVTSKDILEAVIRVHNMETVFAKVKSEKQFYEIVLPRNIFQFSINLLFNLKNYDIYKKPAKYIYKVDQIALEFHNLS